MVFSGKIGLAVAFVLSLLPAAVAHSDDWPQWRGPNRDGRWNETGLLETFPADGLKTRWRAPVGFGWSSPVIAQGRVFLIDSELQAPKATERVQCFDDITGKSLWTYAYEVNYPDWAFTPEQMMGPNATAIVDADRLYTIGSTAQLVCLDALKGTPVWEKNLTRDYGLEEFSGIASSPLIEGDHLILLIGGKRQLIVWTQKAVTSLDPATGRTYWREPLVAGTPPVVATPVFHDDLLLLSGLMLKLDRDHPAAKVLWPEQERKAVSNRILSNTSTPLFQGQCVYTAKSSGELICIEARTGKQLWETNNVTDLKNGASIHLTPNGESVLLYTDRGELIRAQLMAHGYKEISRVALLNPVYKFGDRNVAWAPPAYANRNVYVRNQKELISASLVTKP